MNEDRAVPVTELCLKHIDLALNFRMQVRLAFLAGFKAALRIKSRFAVDSRLYCVGIGRQAL